MKPKTFTYNQIIQFFNDNRLPLNENQKKLISSKVKEEIEKLEIHRAVQKAKKDKEFIKKEKRRLERKKLQEKISNS